MIWENIIYTSALESEIDVGEGTNIGKESLAKKINAGP
jgi:hypothetical protein